jgi:uncharacterized protein YbjT (DUF2867 family)
MPPSLKTVIVTGATGKQGSACVRALLSRVEPESGTDRYHVFALTRDASSPAAKKLTETETEEETDAGHEVTLVQGDLDDAKRTREVFEEVRASSEEGKIWGVFAVLAYPGLGKDTSGEERQGRVSKF